MATTDILPYAGAGGANVDSQATYAAHTYLTSGLANGSIVPAQFFNKILRQSTFIAAGLANWLVNRGINVPDDGNLVALVAELQSGMNAFLSKSVAGGTDVTLDPVLEANYPVINLTGLLTASINVIVPSSSSKWVIKNSTTGNFTITVKTAAGTGVLVQQGTSENIFSDGTNVYRSGQGELINTQYFLTPGTFTYTPTPGTNYVVVDVIGAGGSGGGSVATGANQASCASGGGGGAWARKKITSAFSGVTVTVGNGGAGNVGASGSAGGSSSFGSLQTAAGGGGGFGDGPANFQFVVTPGIGGATPTGGDLNIGGNPGGPGFSFYTTSFVGITSVIGGAGAQGPFLGAPGGATNGAGGSAGTPGAGGAGASRTPNQTAVAGGHGGPGAVIVYEYS